MKRILALLILISLLSHSSFKINAQNPQDCIGAIPICLEGYDEPDSFIGMGDVEMEVDATISCFGNSATGQVEINSVWYTFTTQVAGELCVIISPNNNDDYDYGIYNLTNADCEDIFGDASLEVSCNFSPNIGCGGVTGATGDNGAGAPCAGQNEDCLQVVLGETYAILVTNFSGSTDGYSIDFSQSTAVIFDDVPPEINTISANPEELVDLECGASSFVLNFSENILCESFDLESIFLANPSGAFNDFLTVTAKDCDLGGVYDNQFSFTFEPPLEPGTYFISIASSDEEPTVLDPCSNAIDNSDPSNLQVIFTVAGPVFEGSVAAIDGCVGDDLSLTVSGPSITSEYNWYGPGGEDPANLLATGTSLILDTDAFADGLSTIYVTDTKPGGCTSDPYEVPVNLLGPPIPDFSFDLDCSTGAVFFTSLATDPNPQLGAVEHSWQFGDAFLSGNSAANPSFTYGGPGTYTVELLTSYPNCAQASIMYDVVVPEFPVASFDAPAPGCFPLPVSVTSNGTGDSFIWDFGDGSATATGATASHTYTSAGVYTIFLTAEASPAACTTTLTDTISMTVEAYPSPSIAGLATDIAEPLVFEDITFTANIVDNVAISNYDWSFGDGEGSDESEPQHSYDLVNSYEFCLTVTSEVGSCVSAPICDNLQTETNARIDIPSAFSPNGDGVNDLLQIEGKGVQSFEMRVYNRWGEEVFRAIDMADAWDGTFRGKPQEVDVFLYTLEATLVGGVPSNQEGKISLLR